MKDVAKVFANIEEMIDGMYYLRYVPPNQSKGLLHEVEVKRSPKDKFNLSYPESLSGISEANSLADSGRNIAISLIDPASIR